MDAIVDDSRLVDGVPTSLRDVGFTDVGIDDGWQKCGSYGPEAYRYHNADGSPVVDTNKFPDLGAMVVKAHSLNLTAGWYANACGGVGGCCSDHCDSLQCFAADVNATLSLGFDSMKIDGCGAQRDITLWNDLFNHSITSLNHGKTSDLLPGMLIENCHDGTYPRPPEPEPEWNGNWPYYDEHGSLWCPFHMYRTSGDSRPTFGSVLFNLNMTVQFLDMNLSVPGCWAYADMLEIGVLRAGHPGCDRCNCGVFGNETCPPLNIVESRSQFGAWAIISSPLVLGFDLNDTSLLEPAWDFISNREAIAVNQDYAGFSGTRFAESETLEEFEACSWGAGHFPGRTNGTCAWPSKMYFYKPLSGDDPRNSSFAVLMMNNANRTSTLSFDWQDVPGLNATQGCIVYDIWRKASHGRVSGTGFNAVQVAARDSVFLTLSACN